MRLTHSNWFPEFEDQGILVGVDLEEEVYRYLWPWAHNLSCPLLQEFLLWLMNEILWNPVEP